MGDAKYVKAYSKHLKEKHGNPQVTQTAKEKLESFEKSVQQQFDEEDAKLMLEYEGDFAKVDGNQDGVTRKCKFQNYKCVHCNFTFSTSVKAMCLHVDSHKNDETIRIASVTSKSFAGLLRPYTHYYDANLEKYHGGSNTKTAKIIIPSSYTVREIREDKAGNKFTVTCRKCEKFSVKVKSVTGDDNLHGRAKSISWLEAHEKSCSGTKYKSSEGDEK